MRRFLLPLLLAVAADASARGWSEAEYAGVLADAELHEVSGLAASRTHAGVYWAQNDGGNGARLVAMRADGTRLATVQVDGVKNTDWEDLDSFELDGRHYLMVADTGDNGGIRKTLRLIFIEEPMHLRDGDRLRPAWTIEFRWPDGARDCEATVVDAAGGQVLLVSKKRVPPELFRLPLRPGAGVQVAQPVGALAGIAQPAATELARNPVYGRYRSQVSGADLSPNGRVLAVLNYHSVYLYTRDGDESWGATVARAPGQLRFPWLPQAEAIAFAADGRSLLVGSEQRLAPLLRFRVVP